MSAKAVREHYGKTLLARHLSEHGVNVDARGFLVRTDARDSSSEHTWASLIDENPWAKTTKLVQGRSSVCQQDHK